MTAVNPITAAGPLSTPPERGPGHFFTGTVADLGEGPYPRLCMRTDTPRHISRSIVKRCLWCHHSVWYDPLSTIHEDRELVFCTVCMGIDVFG